MLGVLIVMVHEVMLSHDRTEAWDPVMTSDVGGTPVSSIRDNHSWADYEIR